MPPNWSALPQDEIAARRGIRVNTRDTHREAAPCTRRDSMATVVDGSTDIDFLDWYDRVGEMN